MEPNTEVRVILQRVKVVPIPLEIKQKPAEENNMEQHSSQTADDSTINSSEKRKGIKRTATATSTSTKASDVINRRSTRSANWNRGKPPSFSSLFQISTDISTSKDDICRTNPSISVEQDEFTYFSSLTRIICMLQCYRDVYIFSSIIRKGFEISSRKC